jgi:hypothetical protein
MITSFEVGSVFKIVDQGSPAIRNLFKATTQLDTAVTAARKNMTGLARTRLTGLASQIKMITAEVVTLDRSLSGAANAIGRFAKAPAALTGTTSAIVSQSAAEQVLADEWRAVAASATTAVTAMRAAGRTRLPAVPGGVGGGSVPPRLPPPLPGAGRGGGRHGPRQGFHFGRFGGSIPVAGGHVHASVNSTGAGVAAGAGLWGVYELMKYAKEPMHQEAMLKLLGIDPSTIGQMSREARDIAIAVPGSGYSKNMQNMGELYSIVGAEGAMAIAPRLAEIDRVQSVVGGKGKEQGSAYVLTRATELMGKLTNPTTHKVDLALFGSVIDNMSKMSIASHGKVTPEEWLNYAKQAGPAAGNLTTEGMYTTSAIIQAMGGNRAGTAAAAIQRQFAGGVMTASKAQELQNIGIFKPGDYEVVKGGHVMVKNDAAKSFVDKLQKDPLDAVVKDLIPALESHGFTTNEALTKELYRILGTAPAQREVYEIIRGREQIRQERERAMGALGPGAAIGELNSSDPEAVTSAFTTSFKDLLGALGGPLMMAAIPGMKAMTEIFNNIAKFASDHPALTGVVTSVGGGAAVGGAAGFGVGWLGGPVGAGSGALIGAGAGAGYGIWNQLPQSLRSGISTGASWGSHAGPLGAMIGGYVGGVGSMWGGLLGLNGGAGAPGKDALNVVPPPQKIEIQPGKVVLNLDGRAIGEATVGYVVAQGNGPAQGAPYVDTTRGGSTFDFALVN